jgi:predicted alpha/beta-hydrolase family hydrolase
MASPRNLTIDTGASGPVSALFLAPNDARALYVFAHGAGAGMEHAFMAAAAEGLAKRRIATLRFQFPYMERNSRRPDTPAVAQGAVRAAVAIAAGLLLDVPLYAGGKSFGGRMTSQAQAAEPLPGVQGLVFFGFPLHPAGQPSETRGKHLDDVKVPMLFLQGTRDALADSQLVRGVARRLGPRATLAFLEDADHSFHVPSRTGRTDAQVLDDVLDHMDRWIKT